jgi:nucleoside-triphosphatase THEP1
MTKKYEFSEKWIKASIVGTIWAASEIVLGSFLHNLKIPFSSNLLTGIGIIILISVSYIWTDKGLYWRAGLICAIMKTMSPSAVIFGPMIAIFSEALLLEISVRILGKNMVGFIAGAILAMSWNLFHKIMNFIVFYGFNIVDVYTDLLKYAQKQFNVHFDIVWYPIFVLMLIYCLLGIIAGIIGIKVGRKLLTQPATEFRKVAETSSSAGRQANTKMEFNYSLLWLFANIILIIGSLVLLNFTSLIYWGISITGIVLVWVFRYKRALRQLSKPRFWISFVIITMITAFAFNKIQSNSLEEGLLIGIQMNFRAVIIILGFSVLGTELYNPKIRDFFLKTSYKQLPLALELSFESLPSMIANIPELKVIVKNPVSVIYNIISQVEFRLAEIRSNLSRKIFIISGAIGQGKTTQIQKIVESLRKNNIAVGGIFSPRIMENDTTIGYDVVDITSREREQFLRITNDESLMGIGKYKMFPKGLQLGLNALTTSGNIYNKLVVIDEIGNLELEDRGWASHVTDLLNISNNNLILSVRDSLTAKVIEKWSLKEYTIFHVHGKEEMEIGDLIAEQIK